MINNKTLSQMSNATYVAKQNVDPVKTFSEKQDGIQT